MANTRNPLLFIRCPLIHDSLNGESFTVIKSMSKIVAIKTNGFVGGYFLEKNGTAEEVFSSSSPCIHEHDRRVVERWKQPVRL